MKLRIYSQWRKAGEFRCFCLFNIWYGEKMRGVTVLNFGFEVWDAGSVLAGAVRSASDGGQNL